jgi:flagellar P-ring protein FlgI
MDRSSFPRGASGQTVAALLVSLALLAAVPVSASPSRIKDIAVVNGLGHHKLLGYGLVAGLAGTGDGDSSLLTARSIANVLETFGITVSRGDFAAKNLAAVIVTAELPPIVAVGATLDVTVSSLADAKSLQGGTLLLTPLRAADGNVYAIAQGALTIGGFSAETRGGDVAQKNHVTVGRVPAGASIVKPLSATVTSEDRLSVLLLQPDFTTAARVAQAINEARGAPLASALDNSTIQVAVPTESLSDLVGFIVSIENLPVQPDSPARVVINERTGTVVIGQYVRIDPVAICHGGLTVEVKARVEVSQPPPLVVETTSAEPAKTPVAAVGAAPAVREVLPATVGSAKSGEGPPRTSLTGGRTAVVRQEDLKVKEADGHLVAIAAQATLQDLVAALNALSVKPRDLISIIQALKEAHALQAELVLF